MPIAPDARLGQASSARLRLPPQGGFFARRHTRFAGLFFDAASPASAWIREEGVLELPDVTGVDAIIVRGETLPAPAGDTDALSPGLDLLVNGRLAQRLPRRAAGPWQVRLSLSPGSEPRRGPTVTLRLRDVALTNAFAWLGRVTGLRLFQRFRAQAINRRIRICSVETPDGEAIYDFSLPQAPYSAAFARRHTRLGMNIVGFLTAELGIGESARCMARAADAAGIAAALVPLRLPCKNRLADTTFSARLQEANPHAVTVIHIDPPAARDIDHHHGPNFRRGRYNIGYFAWELPEFPDAWQSAFDPFDEIWCPSDFTAAAVAMKSPLPTLTLPHAIVLPELPREREFLRSRFGLPPGAFLFLTLSDLNSYAARKNPLGALEAFRRSGLAARDARLVVKVHNAEANPGEFARLTDAIRGLPDVILITETLPRADIHALEAACDCLVSLHRSEGFGLVVAECMALAKPVLSTDWSATAEYLDATTGCPVRAHPVILTENQGPYGRGSTWAEPDLDDAAAWMRRVMDDRTWAEGIGRAARERIRDRFSPEAIGARYRARLESIASF